MPVALASTPALTAARLAEYPRRELDLFLRATGSAPSKSHPEAADAVAAKLHAKEPLEKLIAAMRPDARDLFFTIAVGPERMDRTEVVAGAWSHCGLVRERAEAMIEELAHLGVIVANGFSYEVRRMPDLLAGCADAAAAWLAGIRNDQPEPLDLRFLAALSASLVAEEPAKLTQQGRPHARWLEKFAKRLAHPACKPAWSETVLAAAIASGIVRTEPDADGERLRPWVAGAHAAFALPPAEFRTATAARISQRLPYAAVLAARALLTGDAHGTSFEDVCRVAEELQRIDFQKRQGLVPWESANPMTVAEAIGTGSRFGVLSADRGHALTRIRRPDLETTDGHWTVLPNFRVLVPENTPPEAVFRLGLIARLERVDHVAEFVLDRASVARRATFLGLDTDAVTILAERSTHSLPDTVREEVREWDRTVAPVRSYIGAVIVAADASQAASLRADSEAGPEIAPGVFFVAESRLRPILERAKKGGTPTAPTERPSFGGIGSGIAKPPDLAGEAQRFAKRVEAAATAVPVAPPRSGASPSGAAAGAYEDEVDEDDVSKDVLPPSRGDADDEDNYDRAAVDESGDADDAELDKPLTAADFDRAVAGTRGVEALGDLLGVGADLLASRWRHVHGAVRDNPDLLKRACRLPPEILNTMRMHREPARIRELLHAASIKWEQSLHALAATTPKLPGDEARAAAAAASAAAKPTAAKTVAAKPPAAEPPAAPAATPAPKAKAPAKKAVAKPAPPPPPPEPEQPLTPPAGVWTTPAEGQLGVWLGAAVKRRRLIAILYAGVDGATRERIVLPVKLRASGDSEWLDAREPATGNTLVSFRLDRVAAVRD